MQEKTRALWRHYTEGTDGIIYLVDSSDRARMDEARQDLEAFLADQHLLTVPLLVMANKQDLDNVMSVQDVAVALQLFSMIKSGQRQWYIQGTCATTGEGVDEGLEWLCTAIRNQRKGLWRSTVTAAAAEPLPAGVMTATGSSSTES